MSSCLCSVCLSSDSYPITIPFSTMFSHVIFRTRVPENGITNQKKSVLQLRIPL